MNALFIRYVSLLAVPALSFGASGCFVFFGDDDAAGGGSGAGGGGGIGGAQPIGSVAENAEEAWPNRPQDVPVITADDIARACVEQATCAPIDGASTDPLTLITFCIAQLTWSAERAIPVSSLLSWNERAEFYVRCQLDNAGDCSAQKSCSSGRDPIIFCEEDGCRAKAKLSVTCEGTIAHLKGAERSFDRDCARAFAECDPASPTGCTDRQFTACPTEGSKADRCDGGVRLGCDGKGQVSYHDCSRMGGTCGATPSGEDCIYSTPPDPECSDPELPNPSCAGATLAVCVTGKRVMLSAPSVCPG